MQKGKCRFHDVHIAGEVTETVWTNSREKVSMC